MAEQALATTLQNYSSSSSPEKQIQVLEQATALITAHAIDAQEEREVELCTVHKDGENEPDVHGSGPEHQLAVEFESRLLHEHLLNLTQSLSNHDGTREDKPLDKEDRHLANLVRFFQTSLTRVPTSIQKIRSPPKANSRPQTMNDVSLLRLPPSRRMSWHSRGHFRSRSLDDRRNAAKSRMRSLVSLDNRYLNMVTEEVVFANKPVSNLSPLALQHIGTGRSHFVRPVRGRQSIDDRGVVTIFQTAEARPETDLIANFNKQDVEFPEYAKELMDDLDTDDCVAPSPPSRRPQIFSHFLLDAPTPPSTVEDHQVTLGSSSGVSPFSPTTTQGKCRCVYLSLLHSISRPGLSSEKCELPKLNRKPSFFRRNRRAGGNVAEEDNRGTRRPWRQRIKWSLFRCSTNTNQPPSSL